MLGQGFDSPHLHQLRYQRYFEPKNWTTQNIVFYLWFFKRRFYSPLFLIVNHDLKHNLTLLVQVFCTPRLDVDVYYYKNQYNIQHDIVNLQSY